MKNIFLLFSFSFCLLTENVLSQWSSDTLTHNIHRDETEMQSLAVNGTSLHAVWKQEKSGGAWEILYAKKETGNDWTMARNISGSSGTAFSPALAVNRAYNDAYIVFLQQPDVYDFKDIILARDSGNTFLSTHITNDTTEKFSPTIAIDAYSKIHIAWIGKDTLDNWKIFYASNYFGEWRIQMLAGSELGPFGSGASPFLAVNTYGVAHIVYRGGDFGNYHIQHVYNVLPGDTTWHYETISTPNENDFTAQLVVDDMNTLHLLASGNDGWGFPPHAYYRTKNEGGNWSEPQLATSDGAGWGNSLFIDINSKAHILWEETSGNIYTGNLFYASNKTGVWESDSLLCDEKSFGGNFVIDANGFGYALLYNGATFDTEEILALRSSSPVTNVIEHNTFSPQQFSLSQNYPNPFNPTTTIRFEIPVGAIHELPLQTTLKIYNILGEDVATLVNEILPAGNYEREWDATQSPSGLYFYKLTAGKFSETKKLLLLK